MKGVIFVMILFLLSCTALCADRTTNQSEPPFSLPTPVGTSSCQFPAMPSIMDREVRQTPALLDPQPRVSFRDPVFGTCIIRVTDRTHDVSLDDTSGGIKNEYSRVQSFNADGTKILLRSTTATWYLYDAQSLEPIERIPIGTDPRWDTIDPSTIYYFLWATDTTGPRLMVYNIQTHNQSTLHDFSADFPGQSLTSVWTRYEGSQSLDNRYWGLMAEDQNWQAIALLVYDRQTDKVIAKRDISTVEKGPPDSTTISPLGTYVVAQFDYCERGQMGNETYPCGLMVYDRDLTHARGLLRNVGHSDFALDTQGKEVFIYQDTDTDYISLLDLGTGTITPLLPIDFSHTAIGLHFSGHAFLTPGWAAISTYNGGQPTAFTWMDDAIFAIELKPNGRVVRLAHTHSVCNPGVEKDYWAEPQVSVNQDFTRLLFTSNWGHSGTDEVDTYMIELPKGWMERLPK